MLKIWGRATSANVMKPLWVCDEMGVPYEHEEVGGSFGRTKDAAYLAMNPNSRVPTIVDDGFVLWESNAIVRYLANKHGKGSMAPSDPREYADADRWMDWQQTTVLPVMTPIFWGLVR
ncbi:MAG: glutathione S-transferase family protein, partial [Planctomycetota bacterium]